MIDLIIRWLVSALAVMIAAYILPGVVIDGFFVALVVAIVLGFINAFIKPVLFFLTLPITLVTLGLFTFVLNALLVLLTSRIVDGFEVTSFWWAVLFSLVLSLINTIFKRPLVGNEHA